MMCSRWPLHVNKYQCPSARSTYVQSHYGLYKKIMFLLLFSKFFTFTNESLFHRTWSKVNMFLLSSYSVNKPSICLPYPSQIAFVGVAMAKVTAPHTLPGTIPSNVEEGFHYRTRTWRGVVEGPLSGERKRSPEAWHSRLVSLLRVVYLN